MAETRDKTVQAAMLQKIRVETTYEHRDLFGILGWWRKVHEMKVDEEIVVHVRATIMPFDRLYLNGYEIPVDRALREQIAQGWASQN